MPDTDPPPLNEGFVFTRTLTLSQSVEAAGLERHLRLLPGLRKATLDKRRLRVRYDASQLHIDRLLAGAEAFGARLDEGLWNGLRLRWYRFVDANAAQNAQRSDVHCCNKPPRGR